MNPVSWLSLFITVPITVLTVLFVVSNTGMMDIYPYPGAEAWSVPVYMTGLSLLLGGFLAGAMFVSLQAQKTWFRYWQEKQKTARLEKELDALHAKIEAQETAATNTRPSSSAMPALPQSR